MRLIDADAFKTQVAAVTALKGLNVEKAALLLMLIDQQPTVEAEPVVHAYWRRKEYNIDGEITFGTACSECGASQFAGLYAAKYCYKCGARMDADAPERAGKEQNNG